MELLKIRGAREHNLKNIDIDIPKGQLVVISGLSGSGKSSLAFNTIYAEGQRRYVESLSVYARQFLDIMPKPDVDSITGLSPAISVQQKVSSRNPRSTVGTVTEIYDYFRMLFARAGTPYSPQTGLPITAQSITEMVETVLSFKVGEKVLLLAPIVQSRKGEYQKLLLELRKKGFQRFKINSDIYTVDDIPELNKNKKHDISIVVDRLVIKHDDETRERLLNAFEVILSYTSGLAQVQRLNSDLKKSEQVTTFSQKFACPVSGFTISELSPRLFSFNSPIGMCSNCSGLGETWQFLEELIIPNTSLSVPQGAIKPFTNNNKIKTFLTQLVKYMGEDPIKPYSKLSNKSKNAIMYGIKDIKIDTFDDEGQKLFSHKSFDGVICTLENMDQSRRTSYLLNNYRRLKQCNECEGYRLQKEALAVKIGDKHIGQICRLSIKDAFNWIKEVSKLISKQDLVVVDKVIEEIKSRLLFLNDVGLHYIGLSRKAATLSGGENQRMRLASQIGSGLTGVLYVLDEPSIGLHQRDNNRLIKTLCALRDLGNTVIVVEHDEDTIRTANCVIDIGPFSGALGGVIVAQGCPNEIMKNPDSPTGRYLSGIDKITKPIRKVIDLKVAKQKIIIKGAYKNNLKHIDVEFPINKFICVTGVSGSGKSSLVISTFSAFAQSYLNNKNTDHIECKSVTGLDGIDRFIEIDQSPIGRSSRSNPATYIGVFDHIRALFALIPAASARGYTASRFSFNVKGGRCNACEGCGFIKVEMHFLADVEVICDKCQGKQYNNETLDIKYKHKSIAQVLAMTVDQAAAFFENNSNIAHILELLQKVGLGYITLGQKGSTLSGGEAQRIKLAKELGRKRKIGSSSVYILDEPTTGLHFSDVSKLLEVLHSFVEEGDTIIVIEHNLEVIKTADWIIDFGPDGGDRGGKIVAIGTVEDICKNSKSITGEYLKTKLKIK